MKYKSYLTEDPAFDILNSYDDDEDFVLPYPKRQQSEWGDEEEDE